MVSGDDQLLAAVHEPRRRAILRILDAEGGLPVGHLARHFDVSRPAISQHLAVLREAGLVELVPEAGRNHYRVRPERVADARRVLAALVGELPGPTAEEVAAAERAAADEAPAAEAPSGEPGAGGPSGEPAAEAPSGAPGAGGLSGPPPDVALEALARAPREQVFAIAATAAGQVLWLGRAEADAVEGGPFHVDLGGDAAAGTYRVVDPPAHLAFGWGQEGGPFAPDSSRVDLRFTETPEGTLIRLEHRGLPAEAHAPHLASWAYHLPRLAEAAEAAVR